MFVEGEGEEVPTRRCSLAKHRDGYRNARYATAGPSPSAAASCGRLLLVMAAAMNAEQRAIISRARLGGRGGARKPSRAALDEMPVTQGPYPAGASTRTLGLLGKMDALLKAEPQPPRWALLRVLSLLEEERDRESGF